MRPGLYLSIALLSLAALSGCADPAGVPAASSTAAPRRATTTTAASSPVAVSDAAPSQATATTAAATGEIVFARLTGETNTDLFLMHADGTNQQQLTHSPYLESAPRWSPDGAWIAFNYMDDHSDGFPPLQVYTMRPDGSERLQRTGTISPTMSDLYPEWSPDGRRIAYSTIAYSGIWAIDLDGSAPQRLGPDESMPGYTGPLDWSPDGTSFLIEGWGIMQLKTDGTLIKRLTEHEYDRDAAWSPDGSQIAFVRHSGAWVDTPANIFVMNADGSNLRQLTTTPAIRQNPRWSPDGTRIVFASADGHPTLPPPTVQPTAPPEQPAPSGYPLPSAVIAPVGQAPADIFVINSDGSGLTNVTKSAEHEFDPDWKP